MSRRMYLLSRHMLLFLFVCTCTRSLYAQDLAGTGIVVHAYVSQGFLFSSNNNYVSLKSSEGSPQWTDAAVNISDSLADNLRVGLQLHMYQLGEFGGSNIQVDWASGDYRVNDHFGIRAGKVKTVWGLFMIPRISTRSSSGYSCLKAPTPLTIRAFTWHTSEETFTAVSLSGNGPECSTMSRMQARQPSI